MIKKNINIYIIFIILILLFTINSKEITTTDNTSSSDETGAIEAVEIINETRIGEKGTVLVY